MWQDHLGSAFYLVKRDISGNIERLAGKALCDSTEYRCLFTIITKEMEAGESEKPLSCARGLLWLKRAMEFILELMKCLQQDASVTLHDAAQTAYVKCLQPFHGMLTRGVFSVALRVVPSREAFMSLLGTPEDVKTGLQELLENWQPLVQEVHKFLDENGLDDPTPV